MLLSAFGVSSPTRIADGFRDGSSILDIDRACRLEATNYRVRSAAIFRLKSRP